MNWKNASTAIGALAAGATTMFLLDPAQGRRRRAMVRDKMVRAGRVTTDATGVIARDVANRAQGMLAATRSRLRREEDLSPEKIKARARAVLGRVVSHPRAISVDSTDGTLIVSGYILEREVEPLLRALQGVPGVRQVENRLEVGENPAEMPSLQGGRPRPGMVPDILQRRMAPATRVALGGASIALAGYGAGRRDTAGSILAGLGALLGLRAALNMPMRQIFGVWSTPAAIRIQNAIEIEAPVDEVFDFFRHFENFPRFMQHIRRVSQGEGGVWRWEADGPLGIGVSWEAVITRVQQNRRISWKSLPGSEIANSGSVWFEETGRGTTRVHIQMCYNPPVGAVGHALTSLLGANPVRQMDADLVRLKSLIERGKTTAHGERVTREEVRAS